MPKAVKITETAINLIHRNTNAISRDNLRNHMGQYFMISKNPESIAYPWIIWTVEQFNKYYIRTEEEKPNRFVKVRRLY